MFRRKVTGPDGRTWKVGRRWFPRYRKGKRMDMSDLSLPDLGGGGADDLGIIGVILLAIGLFIAAIVLILVVGIGIELLVFRPLEKRILRARGLATGP